MPTADMSWFDIILNGDTDFGVYAFTGRESVSKLFEFDIELVHRSPSKPLTDYIGLPARLSVKGLHGQVRSINGLVSRMEQLHSGNDFTHYRCIVVPRLWFLGLNRDQRIFQQKDVLSIIEEILTQKHGFAAETYEFRCVMAKKRYPTREYCVQYGESDLHFISRLCEEEGIYYFFEHEGDVHKLVFCDVPGGCPIPGHSSLIFHPGSGQHSAEPSISRLTLRQSVGSGKVTLRDWNFERPSLQSLQVQADGSYEQKATPPPGLNLEYYQYQHLYQLKTPGQRYADLQLQRQLCMEKVITGSSDAVNLLPGYSFKLHSHPNPALNSVRPDDPLTASGPGREKSHDWWITEVTQRGEQPGVLQHEAPERGFSYKSSFKAIPAITRFIPELEHPKQKIEGVQSAIVTATGDDEIFTDAYGRVKVKFHWDKRGASNETSSCWVRVSDAWAGSSHGFIQLPRKGQEVLVEFMEGDPDRPVITGRVYNAANRPPWQLPLHHSIAGLQSRELNAGRHNQLILDDTKGEIQAQISSDHLLSQLNLGYITRIGRGSGRQDFRGEGFELRTDGWGAVRAGKGIYLSAYGREHASGHHKDLSDALRELENGAKQHKDTAELAEQAKAMDYAQDVSRLAQSLKSQLHEIKGDGQPGRELSAAHILMGSPDGIELSSGKTAHLNAGEHQILTSRQHTSVSAGKSFLASAKEKICLFAHKLGLRLIAAKGKIEIEAQSGPLDLVAEKELKIFSVKDQIHISSPKEIVFTAGGSYLRINASGIEQGTSGDWKVRSAGQEISAGKTMPWLGREWKDGQADPASNIVVRDEMGRIINMDKIPTSNDAPQTPPEAGQVLNVMHSTREHGTALTKAGESQCIRSFGHSVKLTEEMAADYKSGTDQAGRS